MNKQKIFFILCVSILVWTGADAKPVAEEPEILICDQCEVENPTANKYCVNCGDPLAEELARWQSEQQAREHQLRRFISDRVDPPRLFTVPAARVLGSMDVRIMGGGAFGVAMNRSFLGTVGIGLGDIAEVEFSTVGMVTNISRGSTVFPTSAFKLMLIPENRYHIPTLAIAIRNSANWQDVQSDRRVLKADRDLMAYRIRDIGYDTRFTTMHGVTTLRLWILSIHLGLNLTDVRVRDLTVESDEFGHYEAPEEKQKNLTGGFFGFDIEQNPQTKLMFEVQTVSNFQYNVETREIDVSEAYLAIGGVRFFFNRWLSTDVGVWYQSTFKGIADLQIKLGLNLFLPGGSLGDKVRKMSNKRDVPNPRGPVDQ